MTPEFNASLLREKFIVYDAAPANAKDHAPLIALSNRLNVPLSSADGGTSEEFVIRAQNLHTAMRLGARLAHDFETQGGLTSRAAPYDWTESCESVLSDYERVWNPKLWIAVYHGGRLVHDQNPGLRHPFLDVIEQCDAYRNLGGYDRPLDVARDAFKQAGRLVNISHEANVAASLTIAAGEARCSVMLRSASRTANFFLTARPKSDSGVDISQGLTITAAFLEAIQLAFVIGTSNAKVRAGLVAAESDEARRGADANAWLARLNRIVLQFENSLDVFYRPERPNFDKLIADAEDYARNAFAPPEPKVARAV
jgi:hypothetical protein